MNELMKWYSGSQRNLQAKAAAEILVIWIVNIVQSRRWPAQLQDQMRNKAIDAAKILSKKLTFLSQTLVVTVAVNSMKNWKVVMKKEIGQTSMHKTENPLLSAVGVHIVWSSFFQITFLLHIPSSALWYWTKNLLLQRLTTTESDN